MRLTLRLKLISYMSALFLISVSVGCSGGDDSYSALIQGEAHGALYEKLIHETISPTSYTGAENPADFDVLVISADKADLATQDRLIGKAITNGVPIFYVNLQSGELMTRVEEISGVRVSGNFPLAIVYHPKNEPIEPVHVHAVYIPEIGTQSHTVFDPNVLSTVDGAGGDVAAPSDVSSDDAIEDELIVEAALADHVQQVKDFLISKDSIGKDSIGSGNEGTSANAKDSEPQFNVATPPAYAIYNKKTIRKSWSTSIATVSSPPYVGLPPTRTYKTGISFDIYSFYDPSADEYLVFLSQKGTAYIDTTNDNNVLGIYRILIVPDIITKAAQGDFFCSVSSDNPDAFVVDSSPKNINNSTTYTDGTSYTIGGGIGPDGISVSASYTVSHEETKTIYDWSITNSSSADDNTAWRYYQTKRGNADYNTLPDMSKFNMDFANTSVWAFPGKTTLVSFTVEPKRKIFGAIVGSAKAGPDSSGVGVIELEPLEFTVIMPSKQRSGS